MKRVKRRKMGKKIEEKKRENYNRKGKGRNREQREGKRK